MKPMESPVTEALEALRGLIWASRHTHDVRSWLLMLSKSTDLVERQEGSKLVREWESILHSMEQFDTHLRSLDTIGHSEARSAAERIRHRFLGATSLRQEAFKNTHPINKPKGIDKDIVDEHGRSVEHRFEEEAPGYGRKDIRPEDVFAGTPDQMGVRNLAETGRDLQNAIDHQIPKDKGYDAVSNLSQYLIRTEGGGSGSPAGKR